MFSLTPKLVEIDDDEFFDSETFKMNCSYEHYLDKRNTSCLLLQMVKDGTDIRHTGMSREDTEEERREKLKSERAAAKKRRNEKKNPKPDLHKSGAP